MDEREELLKKDRERERRREVLRRVCQGEFLKSDDPPSMIISTLPFKSSITCLACVGLGLPERLALGAARYLADALISALAILLEGILTATVSRPPVVA